MGEQCGGLLSRRRRVDESGVVLAGCGRPSPTRRPRAWRSRGKAQRCASVHQAHLRPGPALNRHGTREPGTRTVSVCERCALLTGGTGA
jgi:hypothetical protein